MSETTDMTDEVVPISVDFYRLEASLSSELEDAFPEADIVKTSAFSGQELLSLLVDTSENIIRQLAELFQRWKNSGQEVNGKIGDVEFSIRGFSADETSEMMTEIRKVIKEAKK